MIWTNLLVWYRIRLMGSWAPFPPWQFASHKTKICFRPLSAFSVVESVGKGTAVTCCRWWDCTYLEGETWGGMRLPSEARLGAGCCDWGTNPTMTGSANLSLNANPWGSFFQFHFMKEKAEAQSGEVPCWRQSGAEIDINSWLWIQKAYSQDKSLRPRLPLSIKANSFTAKFVLVL